MRLERIEVVIKKRGILIIVFITVLVDCSNFIGVEGLTTFRYDSIPPFWVAKNTVSCKGDTR